MLRQLPFQLYPHSVLLNYTNDLLKIKVYGYQFKSNNAKDKALHLSRHCSNKSIDAIIFKQYNQSIRSINIGT